MSNEAFEKWFENTVLNDNIHDVTLWAWQAAKADSEREIAELRTINSDLIERVVTLLKDTAWSDKIIDMRVSDLIEDVRKLKG